MRKVASRISLLMGALSIAALIWHGFNVGLWGPFELILNFYEKLVGLLRFAEPPLKVLLQFVSRFIAIDLDLHPHWRHSFVLMSLYFGGDVRLDLMRDRSGSAAATVTWGGLIALAASVASGTTPLSDPNMLALVFPAVGFVVYETGRSALTATFYREVALASWFGASTWWETFRFYFFGFALVDAAIGAIAVLAGTYARQVHFSDPSLLGLLVFVVLLANYNLARGLWVALYGPEQDAPLWVRFRRINSTRLGIILLRCIAGAALFILGGAGLALLF